MSTVTASLGRIARDLDALRAKWAVIGGLAVSARTRPRFTGDVDIAVAVATDTEAERLVADLRATGYEVQALLEHVAIARMSTVRLVRSPSKTLVDLLFASSGIEPEIVASADLLKVTGKLVLPVASTGHLIALKLLSRDDVRRPDDRSDLRALAASATAADLEVARSAARLIVERGFHRGRDLEADLDALLAERG
jgi:predicted nucleotidyltransferase